MAFWQYLFLTTWLTLLKLHAILWHFKLPRILQGTRLLHGEADTLKSNPYVIVPRLEN